MASFKTVTWGKLRPSNKLSISVCFKRGEYFSLLLAEDAHEFPGIGSSPPPLITFRERFSPWEETRDILGLAVQTW